MVGFKHMFKSEVAFFTNREAASVLGYLDLFLKDVWLQIDFCFFAQGHLGFWALRFYLIKRAAFQKNRISKE